MAKQFAMGEAFGKRKTTDDANRVAYCRPGQRESPSAVKPILISQPIARFTAKPSPPLLSDECLKLDPPVLSVTPLITSPNKRL